MESKALYIESIKICIKYTIHIVELFIYEVFDLRTNCLIYERIYERIVCLFSLQKSSLSL